MRKILTSAIVLIAAAIFVACSDSNTGQGNSRNSQPLQNPNDNPTEAYKRLFAAVKSGNTEAIRKEVSTKTQEFAKAVAEKRKKTEVEVLSNGFTATPPWVLSAMSVKAMVPRSPSSAHVGRTRVAP